MSNEWPIVEVATACDKVVDCMHETAPTVERPTSYQMVRTPNVENGRIDLSDADYVTKEIYEKWTRRAKLKAGDVLLTREAPLGNVGFVTGENNIFLGQRVVQFRPNPEMLDGRFLTYVFLSPFVQDQIHQFKGSGSVVDNIRIPDCEALEIPLPPLPIQKEIASKVSSFDKKKTLNQRTNRTLESIARAIFKSWFVDFEPVEAKAQGESPTGIDEETAELFPDEFEDLELGKIPKGWEVSCLGDIMQKVTDATDPTEIPGETPYIGLGDMPKGSVSLPDWGQAKAVKSRKYWFEEGQILFGRLRPYFRKVGIAPTDGIASTDIQIIEPKNEYWYSFLLLHLSSQVFIDYCESRSTGTRMPRVRWGDMKEYNIALPPNNLLQKFEDIIAPMLHEIISNINESRVLGETRDTLLPKLISGELEVCADPVEDERSKEETQNAENPHRVSG
jgi:type I restriction enzyme S subunit